MYLLRTLLNKEYNKPIDKMKIAVCFIIIFTIIYYILDNITTESFSYFGEPKKLSFLDTLYFASTTQVTIGYGDILPNTPIAKIINLGHLMIMMYLMI